MTNKISYHNEEMYEVSYLKNVSFQSSWITKPLPQWGTYEVSLLSEYVCVVSSETMTDMK